MKKRILLIVALLLVVALIVLLVMLLGRGKDAENIQSTEVNGIVESSVDSNISATNERPWLTYPGNTNSTNPEAADKHTPEVIEPISIAEKLMKPDCKLYLLGYKGTECWIAYTLRGPLDGDVTQYKEDPVLYYGGKIISESSLQVVDSYTGVVCWMGSHIVVKPDDVLSSDIKLWVVHLKAKNTINQNLFVLSVPDFGEGKDTVGILTDYSPLTSENLTYTHGNVVLVKSNEDLVLLDNKNISVDVSSNSVTLKVPINVINSRPNSMGGLSSLSFSLLKSLETTMDDSNHIVLDYLDTPNGVEYSSSVEDDSILLVYKFNNEVDRDFVNSLNSCYLHIKTETSSLTINIFRE